MRALRTVRHSTGMDAMGSAEAMPRAGWHAMTFASRAFDLPTLCGGGLYLYD